MVFIINLKIKEMKNYKYRKGISFKVDANIAGQELERIYEKYDGITPKNIIKESEEKNSKLHDCFEWSNKKAGYNYRLWQARKLSSSLTIVFEEKTETPAFISISIEKERSYIPSEIVFNNEDMAKIAIHDVFNAFMYFKQKYESYKSHFKAEDKKQLKIDLKEMVKDL